MMTDLQTMAEYLPAVLLLTAAVAWPLLLPVLAVTAYLVVQHLTRKVPALPGLIRPLCLALLVTVAVTQSPLRGVVRFPIHRG